MADWDVAINIFMVLGAIVVCASGIYYLLAIRDDDIEEDQATTAEPEYDSDATEVIATEDEYIE